MKWNDRIGSLWCLTLIYLGAGMVLFDLVDAKVGMISYTLLLTVVLWCYDVVRLRNAGKG